MDPLVELVSEWQDYSKRFSSLTVKDFCTEYLSQNSLQSKREKHSSLNLAKQIGKTNSLIKLYFKIALSQVSDIELEWYYFLDAIGMTDEIRKNDIVSFGLLARPTTGIDIINRMLSAGLIKERIDPEDKRARLVKLTDKGKNHLKQLTILFNEISEQIFNKINTDTEIMMTETLSRLVDEYSTGFNTDKENALNLFQDRIRKNFKKIKL